MLAGNIDRAAVRAAAKLGAQRHADLAATARKYGQWCPPVADDALEDFALQAWVRWVAAELDVTRTVFCSMFRDAYRTAEAAAETEQFTTPELGGSPCSASPKPSPSRLPTRS